MVSTVQAIRSGHLAFFITIDYKPRSIDDRLMRRKFEPWTAMH